MMRFLHILAISGLIGSAAYAYTIKYETLFYAEELVKLRQKLARERESIAVAKAEWALLTRPDRLQRMAEKHLDIQPININQMARLSDLPNRPDRGDEIGRQLEKLGLEPLTTSSVPRKPDTAKAGDARASDKPHAKPTAIAKAAIPAAKPAEPKPPSFGDLLAKALGLSPASPPAAPPAAKTAATKPPAAAGKAAPPKPAPAKPESGPSSSR